MLSKIQAFVAILGTSNWQKLYVPPTLCLAFLVGVAVRSWIAIDQFFIYVLLLTSLVPVFYFWQKKILRLGLLALAAACVGILWYGLRLPQNGNDFVGAYAGRTVTMIGTVAAEPDVRVGNTKLTIGELRITNPASATASAFSKLSADRSAGRRELRGKILITVPLYPEYQYGDVLRVTCPLQAPEPFEGFDYDRYLARYDIYALCYPKAVAVVGQGRGNAIFATILSFKNRAQLVINRGLPEPEASLLSSIVLGSRRGLPASLVEDFNITGLTHLVAISGAQITLIINLLGAVMPYVGISRRKSFYLITSALVVYLILIGAPASAVRAGLMGWLLLFARHVGRLKQAWRVLLYAAVAMVLANPKVLRDDVGFQLSFAAVAGLVYLQPLLEKLFARIPEKYGLREALAMTMAAQIATLPLISIQFGRMSLVSPLSNLLVFPVSAFVMIAGIVVLPVAWFLPLAWNWMAFLPSYFPLAYLIAVAEHLARLPWAQVPITLPGLLLLPSYLALALAVRWAKKWIGEREKYRLDLKVPSAKFKMTVKILRTILVSLAGWVGVVVAATVWLSFQFRDLGHLTARFFDVGQGDAALITTPSGGHILVDGGPDNTLLHKVGRVLPVWDRTIELVVVTHPHADHITGLVELFRRYRVRQVLFSGAVTTTAEEQAFQSELARQAAPAMIARGPVAQVLEPGLELRVLHPTQQTAAGNNLNNASVVVQLVHGLRGALWMGDLEADGQDLLPRALISSDILKVAHHGSADALNPEVARVIQPKLAVISVGEENPYGHPSPRVIRAWQRLGVVALTTPSDGDVTVESNGQSAWYFTRQQPGRTLIQTPGS